MSKRVSKTQQYAMLYMLEHGEDDSEIIKQLKVTQEQLDRFKEKNRVEETNNIKTTSQPIKSGDLMIKNTSQKGNKGVAIMTKESSMKSDSSKQRYIPSNRSDCVHKPNG